MTGIGAAVFAIRMLAIGQVLLVAVVIARGAAPRAIRISGAALLLCTCAYLTLQTPLSDAPHGVLWPLIPLAAQLVPLLLWVFAYRLFERRVDRRIALVGVFVALGCWIALGQGTVHDRQQLDGVYIIIATLQRVVQLALLADAIRIALSELGDDLIEKRRRLRVGFVVVVAVQALMVIGLEYFFGFPTMPPVAVLIQSVAILVATFALGSALLQSDPDILFDPSIDAAPPAPALTPSEKVLKQKLDAAVRDGVYRETGMTIGVLADRLGTPEHRLRALINQRLGYRNFSAFLNHHRIAEAKAMLADPACVDLPILTIAMDLGYGSLAPFNRAFREDVGQAPSDYRRVMFTEKS